MKLEFVKRRILGPAGAFVQRRILRPVLGIDDTPESIALGVSLGLWVAITPTMPAQMAITIALWTLLKRFRVRFSVVAGCLLSWVVNPLTAVPIYWTCYRVGCFVLGRSPLGYEAFGARIPDDAGFWRQVEEVVRIALGDFGVPLWTGCILVGTALALASYPVALAAARRSQALRQRLLLLLRRRETRRILRAERQLLDRAAVAATEHGSGVWWREFPIVLASASETRREILAAMGMDFTVVPSGASEETPPGMPPRDVVRELALRKARAIGARIRQGWILGADTTIVHDGQVVGKPPDDAEAARILELLSDDRHEVLTGLVLLDPATGRYVEGCASAYVRFGVIPPERIREYVGAGKSRGKAGAYDIADGSALPFEAVDGDRSTVLGLPRQLLIELMERLRREVAAPCRE
ncbi:MAG: DUF2062 domain-containing protein [Planctomycetes bacterium]|nr:DUF2062 domain-containing protein [Planctomycetota bacterium]